jgi:hypothetical protein
MLLLRVALTAIVLLVVASFPTAAPDFPDWSAPVNLGPTINSASTDAAAAISKNGLTLYFHSDRSGGYGSTDLWVSRRARASDPWGAPVNLGATINTASVEAAPALSRDEHWLFFGGDRSGGFGGNDIWVSYREHVHDPFDWEPAVNVGAGVNSPGADAGPGYFENDGAGLPQLFYQSTRPTGVGLADIYVSELLPGGGFGLASLVLELSSSGFDNHPSVRFDGLEIFFFSTRPGGQGATDLWSATRATVFDRWSAPTNLGAIVNSASGEAQPYLASDRQTLFFTSDRPGGYGGQDVWMTTRTKP